MLNRSERVRALTETAEQAMALPWPSYYRGVRTDVVRDLGDYVRRGKPLGDFLRAVVEDQLVESFARADDQNERCMPDICRLVYNHVPLECRGDAYLPWIEVHAALRQRSGVGQQVPA